MTGVERWVSHFGVALSGVLCVGLAGVSWHSHDTAMRVDYQAEKCVYLVVALRGELHAGVLHRPIGAVGATPGWAWRPLMASIYDDELGSWRNLWYQPQSVRGFLGFRILGGASGWSYQAAVVPFWAMIVPAGLPPVVAGTRALRRRARRRAGLCATCGYDLRASTGACPECGAADAA